MTESQRAVAKLNLDRILAWTTSKSESLVKISVDDKLEVVNRDQDYFVDYEISMEPYNRRSAALEIQLSGSAIGYTVSDFQCVASILGCRVSNWRSRLCCAGTEPQTSLSCDTMLRICESVSNAKFSAIAYTSFGGLVGIKSRIRLDRPQAMTTFSFEQTGWWAESLSGMRMIKKVKVPFEPW
jgi:hypothetical protein